ncbi:MAG: ATP synthase F1 subunit delta [Alphaproteobacteria bacterium]|nr:ATP synthase F1 subunit delta [Alphaproteobacteria bacterium]
MNKNLIVARRYGTALFQALKSKKVLKPVLKDLEHFEGLLLKAPELLIFITNPLNIINKINEVISEIAKAASYQQFTLSFLILLSEKHRLNLFPEIINDLRRLVAQENKQLHGTVISAQKLNKTQLTKLQLVLKQKSGYEVILDNAVDPNILGGLIVKVASYFIDMSLKTKLVQLNTHLKGLVDETAGI